MLYGDWSKSRNDVFFSSCFYSVIFHILVLDVPLPANTNAHAYTGYTPLALELHILSLAARRARTPARKAAASSSVNPETGQTLVLDTTHFLQENQLSRSSIWK